MEQDTRFELLDDAIREMNDFDFFVVHLAYEVANCKNVKTRIMTACAILAKYNLSFKDFCFWMDYDPTK